MRRGELNSFMIKYQNLDQVYDFCKDTLGYNSKQQVKKSYSRNYNILQVKDCTDADANTIIAKYKPIIVRACKYPQFVEFHVSKDI